MYHSQIIPTKLLMFMISRLVHLDAYSEDFRQVSAEPIINCDFG